MRLRQQNIPADDFDFNMNDNSMTNELLKIATCVIVDNPEGLLAKLPLDIQVTYEKHI